MIPAGVFNQGGESKLFFININGSYWESYRASTRTWPEEYDEFEGMYVTSNNTTSTVTGGYQVHIPIKTGVSAQFGLSFTLSGVIRVVNQPFQTNDLRINRALMVSATSAYTEIIMESLPVGTKYKLHFYGSSEPIFPGSLRVSIIETGLANEVLDMTDTVDNPFVLTPYEPGGDTSWLSTEWRTAVASSRNIRIESVTGQGYLNAFCLEVL